MKLPVTKFLALLIPLSKPTKKKIFKFKFKSQYEASEANIFQANFFLNVNFWLNFITSYKYVNNK
jgi:hypothetical protein